MLNWNQVLNYTKARLSLPSTFIENTDDEMKNYIINTALREFSQYFPDTSRATIITSNPNYKVDGKSNQFYFFDEEGLDIISIVECYFPLDNTLWSGHPAFGPVSMETMKWWALDVFTSKMFAKFSDFNKSYHHIYPNIIEIFDANNLGFSENIVVEYERMQPHDLSKIPVAMSMDFMNLALGHVMLKLGSLRSHYGDGRVVSPFGEIPLNGEAMKQEGKELIREVVDKLIEGQQPSVWIDID